MDLSRYRVTDDKPLNLHDFDTGSGDERDRKEHHILRTRENAEQLALLQNKLYADAREGLVVVVQALDAAGKDSLIRRVFSGLNPQGLTVSSFKAPSAEELAHDYLWRVAARLPRRGEIAVFNRSHYEDVLVARVRSLERGYRLAARCLTDDADDFYHRRYRQIRDFEQYLFENGYRVMKLFLHVSEKEQRKRFLERIDRPDKHWKFNASDLADRALFDNYIDAFERAIRHTATPESPWYIVPADDKWFTRRVVSEALLETLSDMDPQYPSVTDEQREEMARCRAELAEE